MSIASDTDKSKIGIKITQSGKNCSMARTVDFITLSIIILLLTFVWSAAVFSNWIGALIFSCAFTLIAAVTVKYVSKKHYKPYPPDRLALEFSVKSPEYIINIFKSILKNPKIESGFNYIVLQNSLIIAAFRFNLLSINEMSNICSLAEKHDRKRVYVIARGIDRRAYQAVQLNNIKMSVVKIRAVYRYLNKHDALPNLKPVKNRPSLQLIITTVFKRSNVKSYLFSGFILIGVAFLTPLKIYYLVFGSISLLLALISLSPIGNGSLTSPKVFDELNAEMLSETSTDETASDNEKSADITNCDTADINTNLPSSGHDNNPSLDDKDSYSNTNKDSRD